MTAHSFVARLDGVELARGYGFVRNVADGHVEASGPQALLGDVCDIEVAGREAPIPAEVVAIDDRRVVLVPLEVNATVALDARVTTRSSRLAPVGDAFGGRAVDALGRPIDDGGAIVCEAHALPAGSVPRPMQRVDAAQAIETSMRAIDGLLTLGVGQRVGIFAASGVGKTSLIEQLATQIDVDRRILCLVGERGREVEALWRTLSAREDRARSTLVAATSDESAPMRVRAVHQALCLAEHWRDRGEHVLLIIDSVTRMAMALREIGLAAGAPPTVRAYTPNVFAALPRVVERCGAVAGGGAVTAVMTVLSETDDVDDPIVEIMKSLLDGHIVLSRTLAEQGHFPAIDVARSISRQADRRVSPDHAAAARDAVALVAAYDEARVMIESGVYKAGTNAMVDRAIAGRADLNAFLRQRREERSAFAGTIERLRRLTGARGGG